MQNAVLITGGAGFIGSHIAVALLAQGRDIAILDDFSNSSPRSIAEIVRITGKAPGIYQGDVRDRALVERALRVSGASTVVHCAGLKAVAESVADPLRYYASNLDGCLVLLDAMRDTGVKRIVFSSSATVYGEPRVLPISESSPMDPRNPYGWSKRIIEQILLDTCASDAALSAVSLRYFNPVGAHPSGWLGESPKGTPNNLMPIVAQVALGMRPCIDVFGADYPTPDGTAVRDYVHVMDLAHAHVAAIDAGERMSGFRAVNVGTGRGYSVLEVLRAYEAACGRPIPHRIAERRDGDVASCYADPAVAATWLGWRAREDLDSMCRDGWNFARRRVEASAIAA